MPGFRCSPTACDSSSRSDVDFGLVAASHSCFVVLTRWHAREGRLEGAFVQGGDHGQCL